ncbi:geranylgeranyl transferase type-1 subunit beta isoform X1 [Microplitis mediator]|uniref:geranylgeranyl transferase type-1 subunit beta isoform X1 n=1 Tax=Microplitis mediator TaxID=375433 RepID=UPI00255275B5|nr:geranylgeranyl transferase type-1 subunit beta isoform X1 [Microplitis mediator]
MARNLTAQLEKKKHAQYLKRILQIMPSQMAQYDSNRMMFAFFSVSGLDMLDSLNLINETEKLSAIEWIYKLQVTDPGVRSGFQASTMLPNDTAHYQCGYLPMTYTALATLLALGDDLKRVNKKSILEGMRACQNNDGCFMAMITESESDMRFLYCACCVSAILNDWSGINKTTAIDYIVKSISYDGAMGQGPGLESHGGSTFCAVASLYLMNELHNVLNKDQIDKLRRWCLMRQTSGFQGRPGKPSDTCYSFWVGATLHMLDSGHLIDPVENREFILSTQDDSIGGFAKFYDTRADPLHTYLGLCGLSLMGEPGLLSMNAALNVSNRVYNHLKEIHKKWEND